MNTAKIVFDRDIDISIFNNSQIVELEDQVPYQLKTKSVEEQVEEINNGLKTLTEKQLIELKKLI
jgi:hypothetical protein